MTNKRKNTSSNKIASDPSSSKYSRNINSKAHEESPYGEQVPSHLTTYK